MLLKQLIQFTVSSTLRNAVFGTNVERLARSYGSPVLCQSLTTSKSPKRRSRDERRAAVEAFVTEYRAANGGKFPSFKATQKEVGGGYYTVREILQELKHKLNAPLPMVSKPVSEVSASSAPNGTPIIANPLSEVSDSVPIDTPTVSKPFSEVSASSVPDDDPVVSKPLSEVSDSVPDDTPIVAKPLSEVSDSVPNDTPTVSKPLSEVSASSVPSDPIIVAKTPAEVSDSVPNNTPIVSKPLSEVSACSVPNDTPIVAKPLSEVSDPVPTDTPIASKPLTGVTASSSDDTSSPAINDADTEEAKITRQVSEKGLLEVKTEEKSSAWSNIMSFAKEFANYWRKG